ncbi:MAG TPA: DUF4823 domain-containing protein [Thermodesulfobacteriota bacterium]|nr:DUF4823 domain-containing protein [Thermodesulfobacteriota bacterium]
MAYRALIGLFLLLSLVGCADSRNLVRLNQGDTPKLSTADSFYIAVSMDGAYGDERYEGSGLSLSQIILSSLAKKVRRVEIAKAYQTYDEALVSAKAKGWKYLVYPTILQWENHATEWNGIPDKVEVKIQVIETAPDKLVDAVIINGKSGLATFGGDQPQDLLPLPVEEYISSFF